MRRVAGLLFDGVLSTPVFQALGVQHATGRRLTLAALLQAGPALRPDGDDVTPDPGL